MIKTKQPQRNFTAQINMDSLRQSATVADNEKGREKGARNDSESETISLSLIWKRGEAYCRIV